MKLLITDHMCLPHLRLPATSDINDISALLFIPVLIGTRYLNHNDHGKLYCSASQNLSKLDLKLYSDGLSITSAWSEFQSFTTFWPNSKI